MISVFDIGNENFTGNGDVVLQPIECSHKQVAAGKYDLTVRHPLDPQGKWTHIMPESIIRAPVPEETIETAYSGIEADLYRTTAAAALRSGPSEPTTITYPTWSQYNTYSVGSKVTQDNKNYQCVYWDNNDPMRAQSPAGSSWWTEIARQTPGSPVVVNLKSGTDLYYVEGPESGWYKMSTMYGLEGYIKTNQVEFIRHLTPEETQPRHITTQLFRIKTVNVDTKSRTITATAEHVSYDLSGVLVEDAKISKRNPAFALAWIEQNFMIDYRGTIATDLTDDDDGTYSGEIKGKNGTYALLDPDKGIVSTFDAMFRRDNWDVFVMKRREEAASFTLRYRKNMIGVSWNIKSDNLVNRVVPVAKAQDGSDLYLDIDGNKWIDSPWISEQPVIQMERIKVNGQVGKDDGTETGTNWTEETLREEMQKQAERRFSVDKADQIIHEITIDFEMLGDTEEYKALKAFENVLMYDKVKAINEEIHLEITAEVTEIEYDCIRKKITALKLSNVTYSGGRNVSGFSIFNNSITGDKLTDDAIEDNSQGILDESAGYTDQRVDSLNYSLRNWVTNNFVAQ